MTLSKSACDFRTVDATGANGPFDVSGGKQATIDWNVGRSLPADAGPDVLLQHPQHRLPTGCRDCAVDCNAGISTNWPR